MLDDGQAQTGSSHLATARLVNSIEPLENTRQFLFWNADAGVLHRDLQDFVAIDMAGYQDRTAGLAVFNRIIHQVDNCLLDQRGIDRRVQVVGAGEVDAYVFGAGFVGTG